MSDERQERYQKILKTWADQGRVVEGGWQGLSTIWELDKGSELQRSEMRKAFYAGAQHVFASIMGLMGPEQEEPSEREEKVLSDIHKELDKFAAEMAAIKDQ